jgi:hypothetical protein
MKKWLTLLLISLALLAVRRGERLYDGDARAQLALADAVADWVLDDGPGSVRSPGGPQFDGEWALVTCQMAVIGLSQVIEQHPQTRGRYLPAARRCMDWMLTPAATAFGEARWGGPPIPGQPGHAYLGYLNFALARYRRIDDAYAAPHDRLRAALAAGLSAPIHQQQTYPGEVYPADLATVAGSLALFDPPPELADWLARYAAAAVDPATGMLHQRLSARSGVPVDQPRGSGTAFAAFSLEPAAPALSRSLSEALIHRRFLGLGGIREYPEGVRGRGDIDSGPVIFGISVSATGFGIAAARLHGDEARYRSLVATATLFGVPLPLRGGQWHLTGGGIGNAIMLAMLTATPTLPQVAGGDGLLPLGGDPPAAGTGPGGHDLGQRRP